MGTIAKALSLLEFFTAVEPEGGLSALARKADLDKATTRRLLKSLSDAAFIEQDERTRLYRLGPAFSRFARLREFSFPLLRIAEPVVHELATLLEETVHLSERSADALVTVHVEHPTRANRVNVDIGNRLPLHCTASGLAFLAFAPAAVLDAVIADGLIAYTPHSITDPATLRDTVTAVRSRGYSIGENGFEEGVFSIAAPILSTEGFAIGTLAVAAPQVRSKRAVIAERARALLAAIDTINRSLHGEGLVRAGRRA